MYLKQSDLFTGLGHNFLKQTMAIAEKVSFDTENGRLFFKQLSRAIGNRMVTLYARLP